MYNICIIIHSFLNKSEVLQQQKGNAKRILHTHTINIKEKRADADQDACLKAQEFFFDLVEEGTTRFTTSLRKGQRCYSSSFSGDSLHPPWFFLVWRVCFGTGSAILYCDEPQYIALVFGYSLESCSLIFLIRRLFLGYMVLYFGFIRTSCLPLLTLFISKILVTKKTDT